MARATDLGRGAAAPLFFCHIPSPIGALLAVSDGEALCGLYFPEGPKARLPDPAWQPAELALFQRLGQQLAAYFAGELRAFDLPLSPTGTPFQLSVWDALRGIPYGETRSYGELARALGKPDASRAVGLANGSNPIGIVIPCHRVIGKSGALTGFGGGLAAKQHLLALEGIGSGQMTLGI